MSGSCHAQRLEWVDDGRMRRHLPNPKNCPTPRGHFSINPAQQVIGRNVIVEIERAEELLLPARLMTHLRRCSPRDALLSA